jgi:hypothetical protein
MLMDFNFVKAETYLLNYTDCNKTVKDVNGNLRCAKVDLPTTVNFYPSYDYTVNKMNAIMFVNYQLCSADFDYWYRCYSPGEYTYNGYVDMVVNTVGGFSLLGADGTVGSTSGDRPKTSHLGYGGSVYWDRTNSDLTVYVNSNITQTYKVTTSPFSLSFIAGGGFNKDGTYTPQSTYFWSGFTASGSSTIYSNKVNNTNTPPSIFVK